AAIALGRQTAFVGQTWRTISLAGGIARAFAARSGRSADPVPAQDQRQRRQDRRSVVVATPEQQPFGTGCHAPGVGAFATAAGAGARFIDAPAAPAAALVAGRRHTRAAAVHRRVGAGD